MRQQQASSVFFNNLYNSYMPNLQQIVKFILKPPVYHECLCFLMDLSALLMYNVNILDE